MAQQPAWGGSRGRDLTRFLEREAAWILGPAVSFEVEAEDLPPLAADPLQLEACLRELLSHAGAGQTGLARVVRLRITAGDAAAPGARITVEDDAGWPPSLVGRPGGRGSGRLFAVARAIQDQGGDLRLDPSALGGTKVALWLPQA